MVAVDEDTLMVAGRTDLDEPTWIYHRAGTTTVGRRRERSMLLNEKVQKLILPSIISQSCFDDTIFAIYFARRQINFLYH